LEKLSRLIDVGRFLCSWEHRPRDVWAPPAGKDVSLLSAPNCIIVLLRTIYYVCIIQIFISLHVVGPVGNLKRKSFITRMSYFTQCTNTNERMGNWCNAHAFIRSCILTYWTWTNCMIVILVCYIWLKFLVFLI